MIDLAVTLLLSALTIFSLFSFLFCVGLALSMVRQWSRIVSHSNTDSDREWYIVVRYSPADWVGERIDAHFARSSGEALTLMSCRHPLKPDERLRGFWVQDEFERMEAIELHDRRAALDREWEELMNAGAKDGIK